MASESQGWFTLLRARERQKGEGVGRERGEQEQRAAHRRGRIDEPGCFLTVQIVSGHLELLTGGYYFASSTSLSSFDSFSRWPLPLPQELSVDVFEQTLVHRLALSFRVSLAIRGWLSSRAM